MEIYVYLVLAAVLIFYAGMRFERDRATGLFDRRFAADEPPQAYVPSKKQLDAWAKERSVIPTVPRDRTLRNVVFGRPTRITTTRPN